MNSKFPQRRSLRLKNYDYYQAGAYFVTIVVNHRGSLFGSIENDVFTPRPSGIEITRIWTDLPDQFPSIEMDEFCVMPNHFHGIVVINPPIPVGAALVAARDTIDSFTDRAGMDPENRAGTSPADRAGINPAPTRRPSLGEIIGAFKSLTTNAYIQGVRNNGWQPFDKTLWQRNYYEHIIRNGDELNRIRQYIINNPLQWGLDHENPDCHK